MQTAAVVDSSGTIINRVVVGDFLAWSPPDGCVAVAGDYEIGGMYVNGVYTPPPAPPAPPPQPQTVLSQDLMAQFTADDAAKIQAAVTGNVQFWLLWSSLQAQKDPMFVTNARFLAGWSALVQVLGQPRMDAIATELKVTVG